MNPLKFAFLLCLLALLALLALPCAAQSITNPTAPVSGSFYVSVDDHCTIFVNGEKVYHGNLGSSRSPETSLKVGDRVLVHLSNDMGPRHFLVAFASSDGKQVISFKRSDFKLIPEVGVNDFTPAQFQGWANPKGVAKAQKHKPKLPVKSYSESLWGDLDQCIIGAIVTQQMISQSPQ
jgi:hypothetical protein